MGALRYCVSVASQCLFRLEFGLAFVLVEQTILLFVQNGAAGLPGGLISVQNKLLVHLDGSQKNSILQTVTKICQNSLQPILLSQPYLMLPLS